MNLTEVVPHQHGFILSLRRYISEHLSCTQMNGAKRLLRCATTPTFTLLFGTMLSDTSEYHSAVGSLQYMCLIHLDIIYKVNKLFHYMCRPTSDQWGCSQMSALLSFWHTWSQHFSLSPVLSPYMHSKMLIGQVIVMITSSLVRTMFT